VIVYVSRNGSLAERRAEGWYGTIAENDVIRSTYFSICSWTSSSEWERKKILSLGAKIRDVINYFVTIRVTMPPPVKDKIEVTRQKTHCFEFLFPGSFVLPSSFLL
jgi:hypothetical protein